MADKMIAPNSVDAYNQGYSQGYKDAMEQRKEGTTNEKH